jgi:hypothetical protein
MFMTKLLVNHSIINFIRFHYQIVLKMPEFFWSLVLDDNFWIPDGYWIVDSFLRFSLNLTAKSPSPQRQESTSFAKTNPMIPGTMTGYIPIFHGHIPIFSWSIWSIQTFRWFHKPPVLLMNSLGCFSKRRVRIQDWPWPQNNDST